MATTPYLDLAGFKGLTLLASATVDDIDSENPGWFTATLLSGSAWIDARLSKRYATPFASPYPELVRGWLARMVTFRATFKRGYQPDDRSALDLKEDHDAALAEIKEAADAVDGLFDLPLRGDTDASGVTKPGPISAHEPSPYDWIDDQARRVAERGGL